MTVAPSEQRYGLWRLALLAPVTIAGVFQAGMTNMNVFAMTPIYGGHVGLPAVTAVGLVTAFSIGGMLAQAPIGWLSDRLDRRLILLVQGILAASLCAAIVWAGNRFAIAAVCTLLRLRSDGADDLPRCDCLCQLADRKPPYGVGVRRAVAALFNR